MCWILKRPAYHKSVCKDFECNTFVQNLNFAKLKRKRAINFFKREIFHLEIKTQINISAGTNICTKCLVYKIFQKNLSPDLVYPTSSG